MKFLVLLFATVALASASVIGRQAVDVSEDGTIFIRGDHGKEIVIYKKTTPYGVDDVEIKVTGPNTVTKRIQIDNDNQIQLVKGDYEITDAKYDTQTVLEEILREYQGIFDEVTYQQWYNRIQKAVIEGKISSKVLYFIRFLREGTFGKYYNTELYTPYTQQYETKYGYLFNKLHQYGQGMYYGFQNMFGNQGYYYQNYMVQKMLNNAIVQIFDWQVVMNLMQEQGMFHQVVYGQVNQHEVLETIMHHRGIFDYKMLIQWIQNPTLRQVLVQYGIFDRTVLEQLLAYQGTTYNYELLEQLVNREALKQYFVKEGLFTQYFLTHVVGQTQYQNNFYNKEHYGYQILFHYLQNPTLRQYLVQHGVFHTEVYEQLMQYFHTYGYFSQELVHQLVNKEVLRTFLAQHILDQQVLEHFLNNEYLGLYYYLKVNFYHQLPKVAFQQLLEEFTFVPEFVYNYYQTFQYGNELVGINIQKTIMKPFYNQERPTYYRNQFSTKYGFLNSLYGKYNTRSYYPQGLYNTYHRQGMYSQYPVYGQYQQYFY